ncbi:MAG: hypothetical protein ACFCVC_01785 [Acidimicrobiia bacterium]
MKSLRPRTGGVILGLGWVVFLIDRWLLPEGPLITKVWLTLVGMAYLAVAIPAIAGDRRAVAALPWSAVALGMWGMVALVGLSADTTSSRLWMWASVFSLCLGTICFVVTAVPVDRRPPGAVWAYLVVTLIFGGAGVGQVIQCRQDLHASWCDPRYEQEERILASVISDRRPVRAGHFGGPMSPATASFLFEQPPDPLTAVVPRSAVPQVADDGTVSWEFGGGDDACRAVSLVQPAVGGHELRISVDCR